jgi:hypothetical protein
MPKLREIENLCLCTRQNKFPFSTFENCADVQRKDSNIQHLVKHHIIHPMVQKVASVLEYNHIGAGNNSKNPNFDLTCAVPEITFTISSHVPLFWCRKQG